VRSVFVFLSACVLFAAAHATTIVPMTVEELTQAATTVVEAQAGESWSQWNPQRTVIFTYTRFTVTNALKGAPAAQVVVKQPGGVVDTVGQVVPGVRQFQPGENTLLFLRPSSTPGSYVVVGLMQGNFRLYRARSGLTAATNGVPGASALRAGKIADYRGTTMLLDELETRVRGGVR
jgi:hypothetical protein